MLVASSSHLATCPDLGPECNGPTKPIPYNHHVNLFTTDIALDASYGLTPWLAIEARFAVRVVDLTPTYTERDGTPKIVPNEIHHHDVTIVGPTDPWLIARFAAATRGLVTVARFGLTLPIGHTRPDPYRLGAQGKWHEHTQLGTGTFVPIVGLGVAYTIAPIELDLSALAFFSVYENEKGFRAPSRLYPSLRATLPLLSGALRPYVAADLPCETGERWHGLPALEGGAGGRAEVLVGGGLSYRFRDPWQADLSLRARAASLTNAAAFKYPGVLQFGISTSFGGAAKPAR